jgi:tetratricopeptide (TPR) repeat protein
LVPLLCGWAGSSLATWAATPEVAQLETYRKARQFALVDQYASEQLPRVPADSRALLAAAWIRAATEESLLDAAATHDTNPHPDGSRSVDRDSLAWEKIARIDAQYREHSQHDPLALLVDLQLGLADLQHAQQLPRGPLRGGTSAGRTQIELLRRGLTRLTQVANDAARQSEGLRSGRLETATGGLSQTALEALLGNLHYHRGHACYLLARALPHGSVDQIDALQRALEFLDEPSRSTDNLELARQAQLESIGCLRMQGRLVDARRRVEHLAATKPPEPWPGRIAEQRTLLELMFETRDEEPARIERAALQLEQAGELEIAVDALGRAAQKWQTQGDRGAAYAALEHAARVSTALGNAEQASRLSMAAANFAPEQPSAAELHFRGVRFAARRVRDAPSGQAAAALDAYEQLLRAQLDKWPHALTTLTARWWLARLEMSREHFAEAIDALRTGSQGCFAPPTADDSQAHAAEYGSLAAYDEVVMAVVTCYENQLQTLPVTRATAPGRKRLATAAVADLQPVITGRENRWPAQWTLLQRRVALALARWRLRHDPAGAAYAETLLRAARTGTDELDPNWQRGADEVLALAQVATGRGPEAIETLRQLVRQQPGNGELAEQFATALTTSQKPQHQTEALSQWAAIERRATPGGPRWVRARVARIELLQRRGEHDQARKLILLTRTLHPDVRLTQNATPPAP